VAVSKYVEEKLPRQAFLDLAQKDPALRIAEFLKKESEDNETLRYAVLNFLASPYSAARAESIYDILSKSDRAVDFDEHDISRYKPAFVEQLADMHENFQNAPIVFRAALLHDYLFDSSRGKRAADGIIDQVLNRAIGKSADDITVAYTGTTFFEPYQERIKPIMEKLDKEVHTEKFQQLSKQQQIRRFLVLLGRIPEARVLAKEMAKQAAMQFPGYSAQLLKHHVRHRLDRMTGSTHLSEEELAHLTVHSYLSVMDQDEAQLFAAAILVASTERGEGEALSIGKTLHLVLSNMGPAGAKVLQAIDSNPSTPESIRKETRSSKAEHEKPYRFNLVGWAVDAGLMDPNNPDRATYLGPIKGSGSFGVTMYNTDTHGDLVADTILRPRSAEKAAREFKLMRKASEKVARQDRRMASMLNIIDEAERSSQIETKMVLSARQNDVAEQVCNAFEIQITHPDGSTADFTHKVMPMLSHGPKHKRVAIAEGIDFIELVKQEGNSLYVQNIAKAVIAPQIISRFAGLPVDRDRHGGNIKINGNTIQHFDLGATELMLPTSEQKRALGKVVAQAVKDTGLKGGEFMEHLVARIDKISASKDTKYFLGGFTREMLALGDYRNTGVDDDMMKGILGMALYGETVDREIQAGFKREIGALLEPKVRQELQSAAAASGIKVKGIKRAHTITLPELTDEEELLFRVPVEHPAHGTHLLGRSSSGQQGYGMDRR